MNWTRTENSSVVKPAEIEVSGKNVIVRRNFKHIEKTKEIDEHYEFDEMQMTADQYEIYQIFAQQISEQADALIELASIITEG